MVDPPEADDMVAYKMQVMINGYDKHESRFNNGTREGSKYPSFSMQVACMMRVAYVKLM
ncbi:hypothetical protein ACLOJK_023702 [Asimina triloba]